MRGYEPIRNISSPLALKSLNEQLQRLHFKSTNVTEKDLQPGSVTSVIIKEGSIEGRHIKPGAITTEHINATFATFDELYAVEGRVGELETNSITTTELNAVVALIGDLEAVSATIEDLEVEKARINSLETNSATIADLKVERARIDNLDAYKARIEYLEVNSATIENLDVEKARIDSLDAYKARVEHLETNSATITNLDAEIARIDDLYTNKANITDLSAETARINDLYANKASVGDLSAINADIESLTTNKASIIQLSAVDAKIENLTVDTAMITDAAITNAKIANAAIDNAKIAHASIETAHIQLGAITTALIENGAIGTVQIADGSITDAKIVELTANKITAGTLDAAEIEVVNLKAANITVGTINGQQIAPGAIDVENLADGAVTADKLSTSLNTLLSENRSDVDEALREVGVLQDEIVLKVEQTDINTAIEKIELTPGPQGDVGPQGGPGIQGPPGTNGISQYVHIRYSANSNGNPMTPAPDSTTKYVGLANTTSSAAPTSYASYKWALFKGADGKDGAQGGQGIPGTKGSDGQTTYTWVKYADDKIGTGINDSPEGKRYIGLRFNETTKTESNTASHYQWSEMPQNIEIGGRNLLRGSGEEVSNGVYNIASYDLSDEIKEGEEVTLTIWGSLATTKNNFVVYNSGGSVQIATLTDNGDGTYSSTFKWKIGGSTNTYLNVYAFTNAQTGISTINKIKLEKGNIATDWTPAPEDIQEQIDETKQEVEVAQSTADGKNTVIYAATRPTLTGNTTGDIWFNTGDSNRMYRFNGTGWSSVQFGVNAIANLAITNAKIADGTIQNAKISNLDAGKITTGYLSADRIKALSIVAEKIAVGAIAADKIAANAVTAVKIATNAVITRTILAGAITVDKIAANAIVADKIKAETITGDKLVMSTITAREIKAKTITANEMAVGTITAASGIIADAAITNAKIAEATITNAKIANATITNTKIAKATITDAQIALATITDANIKSLNADKITAGTLDAGIVTVTNLNATNITAGILTGRTVRTSAGANRVQMDGTNLKSYYSGVKRVELDYTSLNLNDQFGNIAGFIGTEADDQYSRTFLIETPHGSEGTHEMHLASNAIKLIGTNMHGTGKISICSRGVKIEGVHSGDGSATTLIDAAEYYSGSSVVRGVGIGKTWEQGALDVNGPIFTNGVQIIDSKYVNGGYYIKYSDGTLLQCKHATYVGTVNSVWGSCYCSAAINLGNWAIPFAANPYTFYGVRNNSSASCWISMDGNATTTNAGRVYLMRPEVNNSSVTYNIDVFGIWRWMP